jgi:hypothetical protein
MTRTRRQFFDLLNAQVYEDKLLDRLIEWHDGPEPLSFDAIALRITQEGKVPVNGETVRRWYGWAKGGPPNG